MRSEGDRISVARLAAVSAAVLLISLGLCGANFALDTQIGLSGTPWLLRWRLPLFSVAAILELAGIAVGITGLITALWRSLKPW